MSMGGLCVWEGAVPVCSVMLFCHQPKPDVSFAPQFCQSAWAYRKARGERVEIFFRLAFEAEVQVASLLGKFGENCLQALKTSIIF